MVLNLDTSFSPLGNENLISYESFIFSGGEHHIKIKEQFSSDTSVSITHRICSFNDLGLLLVAVDALRNMEIEKIHLFLPYFPGARQDRVMVQGEPLTVKVYADLINALQLTSITVFDPHSDVTLALINRSRVMYNYDFIKKVTNEIGKDLYLVSPDGGALKKIYKVAASLQDFEVVECSKSRNVKTGKIKSFKVYADDLEGKDCLIVDDICDGGRTFLGLAKELKAKNAGRLFLAVSHGIFSKGFEALLEEFEMIFTTNSFRDIDNERVRVIELEI